MRQSYGSEEKYQLVKRYHNGESVVDICTETGVARSTFYTWLKPYKTTYTNAGTAVSAVEFVKIKNQVARLEQMIEVLQKVDCTFSASLQEKLRALEALHGQYSVHVMCDALQVSRGTFYNHILRNKKENKSYQLRRAQLSEEIKQVFEESNQIYGAKKITAVLRERGTITSDKMVSELMQEMNIYSIRLGAKKNYMQFNYEKKIDSLKMDFTVTAPNQVWVSDVTLFKLKGKMYYICVILDLYSRKAIACRISQKHSTRFITTTFRQAYETRCPGEDLIFHSDRGSQYTAHAFQKLLRTCGVTQSFSPSGKPHHNAVMESFFASMKREELYRTNYHSVAEFMRRIESYIEFYNVKRPHATLSYKTPETHERLFYNRNPAKAV